VFFYFGIWLNQGGVKGIKMTDQTKPGPFDCYCDFKSEWNRKGSDEFWTYYGCPPERWDVDNLPRCKGCDVKEYKFNNAINMNELKSQKCESCAKLKSDLALAVEALKEVKFENEQMDNLTSHCRDVVDRALQKIGGGDE